MVRLVQLVDGAAASTFVFDSNTLSIGRGPDNDIQLDDDLSVSIEHAIIERVGDAEISEFHIRDLQSTNGTFVNEELVSLRRLHSRDVIRIGWSHFVFNDDRPALKPSSEPRKTWLPGLFSSRK